MVLYSRGHPHLTGPGPGHRAQLSEVMPEAWGGARGTWHGNVTPFPEESPTAFWDRMSRRRGCWGLFFSSRV